MMPGIEFKILPLEVDAWLVDHFTRPQSNGWDWSNSIYEEHPVLERVLKTADSGDERTAAIESYVRDYLDCTQDVLEVQKDSFERAWGERSDRFMQAISDLIEIDWPERDITAYLSAVCTINPRFLDTWSFSVYHGLPLNRMVGTAAHEITHFIYFEKWKEVFPDSDPKTFDSPHLEWHLSEIMAPIILNDPSIAPLVLEGDVKARGYPAYQRTMLGEQSVMERFTELYEEERKASFAELLKHAYSEALRYEETILAAR
jgi:hypothetical protein